MQIKPPAGTEYSTRHVLKNIVGGTETVFEWNSGRNGDAWFSPGTGYGTSPKGMATAGWRYLRQESKDSAP